MIYTYEEIKPLSKGTFSNTRYIVRVEKYCSFEGGFIDDGFIEFNDKNHAINYAKKHDIIIDNLK